MTAARQKPGKPTKAELAARDAAIAGAGGPAPPQSSGHGFGSVLGQDAALGSVRRALERNRMPHAVLMHGPVGVGKATCAGILAQALNCATSDYKDACGTCASCRKVARGLHPDVLWVEPEKGTIKVEAVRRLVEAVGYKPYEGARRVVVIDSAHTMNPSAQNALLKTLEEPPPSSILVLVTAAPRSLLPTVRSRCQPLRFQPLPMDVLRGHLEETEGLAPEEARLRAALAPGSLGRAIVFDLAAYGERREVAEAALKDARQGGAALLAAAETLLAAGGGERKVDQASSALAAVRDILRDLLVLRAGDVAHMVVNVDRADDWSTWAEGLAPEAIIDALDAVQRADDRLHGALQPNARLTVEEALVGAGAALRSGRASA